jgi:hypothetical protein
MKHGSRPRPASARVASTWTNTLVDDTDPRMAVAKLVARSRSSTWSIESMKYTSG